MKNSTTTYCTILIVMLFMLFTNTVNAQDSKIKKVLSDIIAGKNTDAKKLLDVLDSDSRYQSDLYFWYARTLCYKNIALASENNSKDLEEARKSFNKLVEIDKLSEPSPNVKIISELRKDLYEGKNALKDAGNSTQAKVAEVTKQTEVQDADKTVKDTVASSPSNVAVAQNQINTQNAEKTISLVVSGQGKTPEEAKQIALRSAIEQAFGTYISSNTTILNDSIIRDEIISVANGNIEKFEILSEVKLPNGSYASSIKAVVSISKLTNFCESKGVTVTLKGGLFAANIKQQQLNEKNEVSSIKLLSETAKSLIDNMFDYSLTSSEPKSIDGNEDLWALHLSVGVKVNENFLALKKCLFNTLASLCLTGTEANDYIKMEKPVYQINFEINDTLKGPIYLRSEKSTAILQDLTWYFYYSQSNFVIKDGIRDYPFDMLGGGGEYEYPISEENKVILKHDDQTSLIYYESMNGIILKNRTWSICLTDLYNPPHSFERTTYALEKKNIYENTHNYYNPQSWDSEENLADKAEELRYFKKICADSVTCFTYFDEAVRYGFDEYAGSGGQHYFGFNLNPPKNEYGKFNILLKYNTDELAKITALTVKPYLTLMQRKY